MNRPPKGGDAPSTEHAKARKAGAPDQSKLKPPARARKKAAPGRVQRSRKQIKVGPVILYDRGQPAEAPAGRRRPSVNGSPGIAWTIVRQAERLIRYRHRVGHCDTSEGELYLEVVLPQLLVIQDSGGQISPRAWAERYTPHVFVDEPAGWFEALVADHRRNPRTFSDEERGARLHVRDEEWLNARAVNFAPIDSTKAERKERQRRAKADKELQKRAANGARPHAQSAARTKPWETEGVSRRTWYDRRRKEKDSCTNSCRPTGTVAVHDSVQGVAPAVLRGAARFADSSKKKASQQAQRRQGPLLKGLPSPTPERSRGPPSGGTRTMDQARRRLPRCLSFIQSPGPAWRPRERTAILAGVTDGQQRRRFSWVLSLPLRVDRYPLQTVPRE